MEKAEDNARKESRAKLRRKAQRAIEQAEEEHRRALLRKRIELAHAGLDAYKKGHAAEAVRQFQTYIGILEHWKNVGVGNLTPAAFDMRKDIAEMLLISGVYWDLVKLYDRTVGKKAEFQHYLEKFILFSKGMPFEALCSESIRKYISTDKPVHKDDFRNAYKMISNSRCFVATSLIDVLEDAETIPRLRRFRDERLMTNLPGWVAVRAYYLVGPVIAAGLDRGPPRMRRGVARVLDQFARGLFRALL